MKKKKNDIPKNVDLWAALGQMVIVSFPGDEWNHELEMLVKKYQIGGVIFFQENIDGTRTRLKSLTKRLRKRSMENTLGLPPFITVDEEGGRVSRLRKFIGDYPPQRELGQLKSKTKLKASYASMAQEVRKLGFNVAWSPVLDIDTNPNNPVIGDRAFGSDAKTVIDCGREAVRAMRKAGLYTTAKHYPGHGDTPVDSHKVLPVMKTSKQKLMERELKPFRMAVAEKVDFIMTAHIFFQKIDPHYPVTFSPHFITKILRKELKYAGLVVTDDLNMGAATHHFSVGERIALAVNAGIDVLLIRSTFAETVEFLEIFHALVTAGMIPYARIAESVARIEKVKKRYEKSHG